MPELPEVETITRGLAKRVTGDIIETVWIGSRRQPLKSPARKIAAVLEGKRIARIHRAGKHIVIDLDGTSSAAGAKVRINGREMQRAPDRLDLSEADGRVLPASRNRPPSAQWIVHLGMTGRLVVTEPAADIVKHTHLIAKLASGRELRFVDPRMFGKLSVYSNGFDPGGVEPLEVSEEKFFDLFRGRKTPIKSALLNQKLLRGVGNIYADEALFRAGIRPRRRAASLRREDLRRLYHSVQKVLREAIESGGSSISDYVDADGEEGFFQLQHRVYGREGEACLKCQSMIKRVVLVGRSSHYCPACQR